MPDSPKHIVKYLPSMGLNITDEPSSLDPRVALTCTNFLIDEKNLKVRRGILNSTYPITADYSITSAIIAEYADGTENTFIAEDNGATQYLRVYDSGATPDVWRTITLPEGASIASSATGNYRGNFAQYKDSVYYSDLSVRPVKIPKGTASNTEYTKKAGWAGTISPDTTLLIDMWEDDDDSGGKWTASAGSGGTATVATETNSVAYLYGDGGITLQCSEADTPNWATAELAHTFTWTKAGGGHFHLDHLDSSAAWDSDGDDILTFYLHRWSRKYISSISLRICKDVNNYFEAKILDLTDDEYYRILNNTSTVQQSYEYDADVRNSVTHSLPPGSIQRDWNNDRNDNVNFFVKLKKDYFTRTGTLSDSGTREDDWKAAFTMVKLIVTTTKWAATATPAKLTVNYFALKTSPPTAITDGVILAKCEPCEAWKNGSGTAATFNTVYKTEGANSVQLTVPSTDLTQTIYLDGPWDLTSFGSGIGINRRDRILASLWVHADDAWAAGSASLILTDHAGVTCTITRPFSVLPHRARNLISATYYYHPFVKRLNIRSPLIIAAYDCSHTGDHEGHTALTHNFSTFTWSDVHRITISITAGVNSNTRTLYAYVDKIFIKRGTYSKKIVNFAPGAVDALSAADSDSFDALGAFPRASALMSTLTTAADFIQQFKYKTVGEGYFVMPDTEHKELSGGSFSSLRIAAGGDYAGFFGSALNALTTEVDGFRFIAAFRSMGSTPNQFGNMWGYRDLTTFARFTNSDDGTTSLGDLPITDSDEFRIWTWISDPTCISKIRFRLYMDPYQVRHATKKVALGSYYKIDWRDSELINGTDQQTSYVEYEWDVRNLPNPEEAMLFESAKIRKAYADNPINKYLDRLGDVAQYEQIPKGAPDFLVKLVENVDADKIVDSGLATMLFPNLALHEGGEAPYGINHVIKWRRADMTFTQGSYTASDESTLNGVDWSAIIGFSIEVIPLYSCSVEVCFDNWAITCVGALTGRYQYVTTFVDDQGQESSPSLPSEKIEVEASDVYLYTLPQSWPYGIDFMNIYRTGGDAAEWNLVGSIQRPSASSVTAKRFFLDHVADNQLGRTLVDNGRMPPKCKVIALSGDRMIYANIIDEYDKTKPSRLYISENFRPGCCKTEMIRDIRPSDGQEITAVANYNGVNAIFKTRSIWTMDMENYEPVPRFDNCGCYAQRTVCVHDTGIYFLSTEGPAKFDISGLDISVGRPVKGYFSIYRDTNAVGFIFEDYYYIFKANSSTANSYGLVNDSALCMHIPSGAWSLMQFKITSTLYARVTCAAVNRGNGKVFLGTTLQTDGGNYDAALLDLYTNSSGSDLTADCSSLDITATYQSANTDLGVAESQKNLKAYYIRAKLAESTPTIAIENYVEESDIGSAWDKSWTTSSTPALASTQVTYPMSVLLGINGFLHGVKLTSTKRTVISLLSGVYDIIPMRLS